MRPFLLFLLLYLPACGATQPVPVSSAIQVIKATSAQLTGNHFSIDSLSRQLRLADTAVRMRAEYPIDTGEGIAYLFYTQQKRAEEQYVLRISGVSGPEKKDSIRATGTFFIAGGYNVKGGKLNYERSGLHALSIADMKRTFGQYTEDPFNKLRKESNRYTFSYRNSATGRKATIDVMCVYDAKATHNFVSTVTIVAY